MPAGTEGSEGAANFHKLIADAAVSKPCRMPATNTSGAGRRDDSGHQTQSSGERLRDCHVSPGPPAQATGP